MSGRSTQTLKGFWDSAITINSRLTSLLSIKLEVEILQITTWIRTKISFALLRSIVLSQHYYLLLLQFYYHISIILLLIPEFQKENERSSYDLEGQNFENLKYDP